MKSQLFPLATGLVAYFFSGCAFSGSYQTASTLEKGQVVVAIEPGFNTTGPLPAEFERPFLVPDLGIAAAVGLGDLDVGLRFNSALLEIEGKAKLATLSDGAVVMSLRPAIGMSFEYGVSASLTYLTGWHHAPGRELVLGLRGHVLGGTRGISGLAHSVVVGVGPSIGYAFDLWRLRIVPEVSSLVAVRGSYHWAWIMADHGVSEPVLLQVGVGVQYRFGG